jgi:hypothetical protein
VTVNGVGGNTGSTNNGVNVGVFAHAGNNITSGGGNVDVNGTGGGKGGSRNVGVLIQSVITAGGSGTVTVGGRGGDVTGAGTGNNFGVRIDSVTNAITSGGGDVVINAIEGGGGTGTSTSVGLYVNTASGVSTKTNGGNVTVNANSVRLDATNALQTNATSSVTIQPRANGVGFNLGSTTDTIGGPISFSNTELGYISTGTLNLGNGYTGPIVVSSEVTIPSAADLNLTTASSSAGLTPTNSSITMGSGKTLGLANIPSVNIAIGGTTLGPGYGQLSVSNSAVTLTGKDLVLSGSYTPAAGNVFTIVSAPAGITGTFNNLADGNSLTFNGRTLIINYTSTTVTLTDPAPAVTANPSSRTINLGSPVTFTTAATGTPTPTVRWQVNSGSGFVDISPAETNSTLTFTPNMTQSGYQYRAVFTNTAGTATTNAATLTVNKATTTTTLTSSASPSTYGNSVTFTATVTSGATGTVTFKNGSTTIGTATLTSGTASFTTSSLGGGSNTITAVYVGDSNYATSTSSTLTQTVNQAASTTTLVSSANPSTAGDTVTFTATVTSGATGTVTFKNGLVTLGTGAISSGTATFSTSALAAGSHTITAVYDGDANYATSTSSGVTQVVKVATTTTLTSSANPISFGSSITFTATVTSSATGTVLLMNGSTTLGTATLSSGTATFTVSGLAAGMYNITAAYQGSSSHASSTSNPVAQVVTAVPVVTSSPTAQAAGVGSTVTFTASATGFPVPNVQWQISTNGGLSWTNIVGATSSSYTTPPLTAGSDGNVYRAVYTNIAGSAASGFGVVRVNQAPAVTLQPADVATTSGATATFTATASGWTAPSVQWQINGGSGWSDITGATGNSYTTPSLAGSDSGNQYRAVFSNSLGSATTNPATLTIASLATITNVAVGWGTQTANLVDVGSERLLPTGRTNTIAWQGIKQITLTLDQPIASLTTADITLSGNSGFSYGVASVSGSGTAWTITLSGDGLVNADRVTVNIGGGSIVTYSRRLDVLPGDVNDDGNVTSLDQLTVSRQIALAYNSLYDIDGSGSVSSTDVSLVKSRLGRKLR